MPFASSFANSEDRRSSSISDVASSGGPRPGTEGGRESTRVFVRGRAKADVVTAAVGGGADGVGLDVNSSRTSGMVAEIYVLAVDPRERRGR